MTRAQRRIRSAKNRSTSAGLTTAFRNPVVPMVGAINANPNTGKRHAAPATAREHSLTRTESDTIKASRRDYRPLTVRTPIKRARIAPKFTAYTI